MNEKELRIGNFVKVANEETGLSKDLLVFALEDGIECFSPIPLTEGWLTKLGFVKRYSDLYECGKFILNNEFIMLDIDLTVKLEYVHQLQNLYFALTEEELVLTK